MTGVQTCALPISSAVCRRLGSRLADVEKGLPGRRRRATFFGRLPTIRIDHIFVSAGVEVSGIDIGADDYVVKPFGLTELFEVVARVNRLLDTKNRYLMRVEEEKYNTLRGAANTVCHEINNPLATIAKRMVGISENPIKAAISLVRNPDPTSRWRRSKYALIRLRDSSSVSTTKPIKSRFNSSSTKA